MVEYGYMNLNLQIQFLHNFLVLYYDELGKMNEENLVQIEENIEDIWDHFMFMSKSLNGIEENYKNRVFLKKGDFTIIGSGQES